MQTTVEELRGSVDESFHLSVKWPHCIQGVWGPHIKHKFFTAAHSNLDDLLRTLGWLRLYYQRWGQKSILMYKTLHGKTPDYLRSRFVYHENVCAYRLRNTENKLVLPQPRTDYLKRSFLYSGAQLWNNLPVDLRQASSLTDFKSILSRHSLM